MKHAANKTQIECYSESGAHSSNILAVPNLPSAVNSSKGSAVTKNEIDELLVLQVNCLF